MTSIIRAARRVLMASRLAVFRRSVFQIRRAPRLSAIAMVRLRWARGSLAVTRPQDFFHRKGFPVQRRGHFSTLFWVSGNRIRSNSVRSAALSSNVLGYNGGVNKKSTEERIRHLRVAINRHRYL